MPFLSKASIGSEVPMLSALDVQKTTIVKAARVCGPISSLVLQAFQDKAHARKEDANIFEPYESQLVTRKKEPG